jgi:crotonobetainyl-CoA:carnitine CoA-transferase CaiB-like acyl-CoA transferase
MRPGAAERLGFGFEQALVHNPAVIYLYAPGWGSAGPDRQRQAFAPLLSGYVGASHEVAGQFNDPLFPLGNEDPGTGLLGAAGILLALYRRQALEAGQYIENSQLNATMTHMAHVVRRPDGTVLGALRLDPLQTGVSALDRLYETADGWLAVAVAGDAEVARLGEVLSLPLGSDDRFCEHAARVENDDELYDLISGALQTRPTEDWVAALTQAGLGAVRPITENNSKAFHRDAENHRTGRVVELTHPKHGVIRELDQLIRVSGATVPRHRPAPALGAHTREVLVDLGYSPDALAVLEAKGALRSG